MLNINRILLGNFRVFSDMADLRLAPLTILTGPNNSGKSSFARSLSLMKNLDMQKLPFRLRFDRGNSMGGFENISHNRSGSEKVKTGYELYNILLGENVRVEFTFVRGGHFDARVKKMSVRNINGLIFEFEIAENRINTRLGAGYLYDKLRDISVRKKQFMKLENDFRKIHSSSGTTKGDKGNSETGVPIFHADNTLRRQNINEYLKTQSLTSEEYERLSWFFGNRRDVKDSPEKEFNSRARKILDDFIFDDILFNNDLLSKIIDLPQSTLEESDLRDMIKKDFPDLFDCMLLLNDPELLNRIAELLRSKSYSEWEKDYLECDIATTKHMKGLDAGNELNLAIEHHLQARFELQQFFRAITELSMTREGFLQSYTSYRNIKAFSAFAGLVIEKILEDIRSDINWTMPLNLTAPPAGPYVDYDHPMHDLIRNYSENRKKETFIKKWFSKFRICDDFSIDAPVKDLGYFPGLIRNNEKVTLSGDGEGSRRLLMMLLGIAGARKISDLRDYNGEQKFNTRTIILEEPETGLHPSWQSKLGDMFVDARQRLGLHFLIETHSEYLINKVQYLVATGKLDRNDVVIYYFDQKQSYQAPALEITLDDKGNLSREIPSGFLDEEDLRALGMFRLKKISKN